MAFKGLIEDKSGSTPPKPVVQLHEALAELKGAMRALDRSTIASALEDVEGARLRVNALMISLSQQGGNAGHIQACSDACNAALDLRARATIYLSQPQPRR